MLPAQDQTGGLMTVAHMSSEFIDGRPEARNTQTWEWLTYANTVSLTWIEVVCEIASLGQKQTFSRNTMDVRLRGQSRL